MRHTLELKTQRIYLKYEIDLTAIKPIKMAREFVIRYSQTEKLDSNQLATLDNVLKKISNEKYRLNFLEKQSNDFVYGFKLLEIPKHDWIWDGFLFLNQTSGIIQFNIGNSVQIASFCKEIQNVFNASNIQITTEED